MKKISPLVLVFVVFVFVFLYLHQKIQIYVTAFDLSRNYSNYQKFSAKKDYLMYNFSQKASLACANQWSSNQKFSSPGKEKLLVFKPYNRQKAKVPQERFVLSRLRIPASISEVFAKER